MVEENKKKKNSLQNFFAILFVIICIIYGFIDFSNVNTRINIKCDKKSNNCTIQENKLFLPSRKIDFTLSDFSNAEKNVIGCRYGVCNYSLRIHLQKGTTITTFYGFLNGAGVEKAADYLNEFALNSEYKNLIIDPQKGEKIIIPATFIGSIIMTFLMLLIVCAALYKKRKEAKTSV